MICRHLTNKQNTRVANNNVLEEKTIAIHPLLIYLLYHLNYKNQYSAQLSYMSHHSQIFQVLLSPQEYQQLINQKQQFQAEKNQLNKEVEQLNKKLRYLTEGGEEILDYPKKIYQLSKKVIQLSKLAIRFQQSNEQLKSRIENAENSSVVIQQQKQQILNLRQKVKNQISKNSTLNAQIQQLRKQINKKNDEVFSLKQQIETNNQHYQTLYQQFTKLTIEKQQLSTKLEECQQQQKQRNIMVLNERNFIQQQTNSLKRLQLKLAETESTLLKKQKQLSLQFQLFQQSLEQKYKRRQKQLEQQYMKQIASIKHYSIYDDKIEQSKETLQLRDQLTKIKQQNAALHKRASLLKKQREDAINKLSYFKEYYESIDNIDHSIINAYVMSLVAFKDKLVQVGESNVLMKVVEKKNQMLHALQRKIKQTIN